MNSARFFSKVPVLRHFLWLKHIKIKSTNPQQCPSPSHASPSHPCAHQANTGWTPPTARRAGRVSRGSSAWGATNKSARMECGHSEGRPSAGSAACAKQDCCWCGRAMRWGIRCAVRVHWGSVALAMKWRPCARLERTRRRMESAFRVRRTTAAMPGRWSVCVWTTKKTPAQGAHLVRSPSERNAARVLMGLE